MPCPNNRGFQKNGTINKYMEGEINKHHRRSIRLPGADYSVPGFYFVTACILNREWLFGEVVDAQMRLSELGKVVQNCWDALPNYFVNCVIDEFQIMPNHVHGIIGIVERRGGVSPPWQNGKFSGSHWADGANGGGGETPPLPSIRTNPTLGQIVGYFKYQTTKIYNADVTNEIKIKIWQRNYFEHIIRDQKSLERIRVYIRSNPFNWQMDLDFLATQHTMTETEYIKKTHEHYRVLFDA